MDWQKDDIECAIASFVNDMSPELYEMLSEGKKDFLLDHLCFGEDMIRSVEVLEKKLALY